MGERYRLQLLESADALAETACRAADAAEEAAAMLDFTAAQDELKYARNCAQDALKCARYAKGMTIEKEVNDYAGEAILAVARAKRSIKQHKGTVKPLTDEAKDDSKPA